MVSNHNINIHVTFLYCGCSFFQSIPQKIQLFEEACSLSMQSLSQSVYFPVLNNSLYYKYSLTKQTQYVLWLHLIKNYDPQQRKYFLVYSLQVVVSQHWKHKTCLYNRMYVRSI